MILNLQKQNRIYKKLYTPKPPQKDGLLLSVSRTTEKIRFIQGAFDETGNILALSDQAGNIFAIDFNLNKFWNLTESYGLCTVLKCSSWIVTDVLIGSGSGLINIIDLHTGLSSGALKGHQCPVCHICFTNEYLCLTASSSEGILWNLKSNCKLQVLNLSHNCTIKFISFVPVSNDVVTVLNDDVLQVWKLETFAIRKQIDPVVWYNHDVKDITFTLDGKIMVIGCRSPHLAVFLVNNFKLFKFITLPEKIQTIRFVTFVSQINDGGANRVLTILSSRGTVYFYDFEQNMIISELHLECRINKLFFSPKGNLFSCLLCSGFVNTYDTTQYIVVPTKFQALRSDTATQKLVTKKQDSEKKEQIKMKIQNMLEFNRLRLILKEKGEYPESYRTKIWQHLLQLPNNKDHYNAVINHRMIISFADLCKKYPLKDKKSLKNLKRLLDNLVTWCPFFENVDYLPQLVFPFVKIFTNQPIACFEAAATVLINWCEFWFEYFPLEPVNILAMIENVLIEHDPELLNFFVVNNVKSTLYGWYILRTLFSEVLTASQWRIFWDHVFSNELSFLLFGVVAYNILQRSVLMSLKSLQDFDCFYTTHHPIEIKRLVGKTYALLNSSSDSVHPRQYLNIFSSLPPGEYHEFSGKYPKFDNKFQEMEQLKSDEADLLKNRMTELNKWENFGVVNEEADRVLDMEHAICQQLQEQQERIHKYYEKIMQLRQKFREDDAVLENFKGQIAKDQQQKSRRKHLKLMLEDVTYKKREKDYQLTKLEDELVYHYSELLRNKTKVEQMLEMNALDFEQQQDNFYQETARMKSSDYLKPLNVSTSLAAIDGLINKVTNELQRQQLEVSDDSAGDRRITELKAETKDLAVEVNNLMQVLAELRDLEAEG